MLLREGGNAVDAAVAAAFAAFVCELPLCSPLGGGVMVLERPDSEAIAFDMFARTPGLGRSGSGAAPLEFDERAKRARSREFDGVEVSFGAASQVFHVGRASVAVPLAFAGLLEVHRRHGALPLPVVMAPAVALGRDGYVLGPGLGFVFDILRPIVSRTAGCKALFVDDTGAIARAGARLSNTDMAACFEDVGKRPDRLKDLYAALAREMSPSEGGLMTEADVVDARVRSFEPVVIHQGGWRLATMPSPSTGGVLVALGLKMLEGVARAPFLSREHVLFAAKVQEALLAERDEGFAERCADPEVVRAMLADERVAVAREKARNNLLGSTTQISAISEDGTAVSLTLTNGEGSGHVLTGTGMIANNLLGEQDLHPRGFHRDPPGAPLMTMMAPTLLSRGTDRVALGSGGSNRLRTAILQVLTALVEYRLSPVDTVAAPRLHIEIGSAGKPVLAFEAPGLAEDVAVALKAAYPDAPAVFDAPNLYFGGVHLAMRTGDGFEGVGDGRRSGARVIV
jgi:gamma-glutamyltranspeptidase/glutathione hydrolase